MLIRKFNFASNWNPVVKISKKSVDKRKKRKKKIQNTHTKQKKIIKIEGRNLCQAKGAINHSHHWRTTGVHLSENKIRSTVQCVQKFSDRCTHKNGPCSSGHFEQFDDDCGIGTLRGNMSLPVEQPMFAVQETDSLTECVFQGGILWFSAFQSVWSMYYSFKLLCFSA